MNNALWIGLLSALSALAGAAISQWGALRATSLQSTLETDRDTLRRQHESDSRQAAVLAQKREEFLGLALLAQNRMLDILDRHPESSPGTAADKPASAARQAYAVALLYLGDMRPLAKAFYEATAALQLALTGDDVTLLNVRVAAWTKAFSEIEDALAG